MKVESSSAQINVCDNDSFAGVNINPALSGYAADIMFWGGAAYLCRRKDDSFLRVVMVPGEKWLQDIKDAGYEVVGSVSACSKLEGDNARLLSVESDMASIADLLNTWARECGVDEAHGWSGSDIKAVIDRLWARANQGKI